MLTYHVKKGDTIAGVTRQLNTNWETLRQGNPNAIGRSSKNGNWFLKEGSTVKVESTFRDTLEKAEKIQASQTAANQPISIPKTNSKILFPNEAPPQKESAKQGKVIEHTLQAGETLWSLAVKKYHVHIRDIMADNNISDPRTLQIGQVLKIRLPESTGEKPVVASWYGEDFHGKPMANGDIYDMHAATIAHKEMPLGTKVELKNTKTGERVQAVVTDRGPYIQGRDVDLSYGLAQRLSLLEQGVGNLVMRVL